MSCQLFLRLLTVVRSDVVLIHRLSLLSYYTIVCYNSLDVGSFNSGCPCQCSYSPLVYYKFIIKVWSEVGMGRQGAPVALSSGNTSIISCAIKTLNFMLYPGYVHGISTPTHEYAQVIHWPFIPITETLHWLIRSVILWAYNSGSSRKRSNCLHLPLHRPF